MEYTALTNLFVDLINKEVYTILNVPDFLVLQVQEQLKK